MRIHLCLAALLVSQTLASAQNPPKTMEEMHKLHQNSKAYIALLEDPARDAYQKPKPANPVSYGHLNRNPRLRRKERR